MQIFQNPTS